MIAIAELIRELVTKMQKNPIVFYIDDEAIPVSEINFPAVSMCPGLVIRNGEDILIDYNKLKKDFESGVMTSFTGSEYESENSPEYLIQSCFVA
jgi:hypothetical protein